MEKAIYAETTFMYRPVLKNEVTEFKKAHYKKRKNKRNIYDYRKKLFSSNYKNYIMLANGLETDIEKGTKNENIFWHVKDVIFYPGNNYYFSSPEDAERTFRIKYSTDLKRNWYEVSSQYRVYSDDESTINDVTIVK